MRAFNLDERLPVLLFASVLLGSVFTIGAWFDRIADQHERERRMALEREFAVMFPPP